MKFFRTKPLVNLQELELELSVEEKMVPHLIFISPYLQERYAIVLEQPLV